MMGRTTGMACTAGTARATGTASTTAGPPAVTATGPPRTSCSNLQSKPTAHEGRVQIPGPLCELCHLNCFVQ